MNHNISFLLQKSSKAKSKCTPEIVAVQECLEGNEDFKTWEGLDHSKPQKFDPAAVIGGFYQCSKEVFLKQCFEEN